ncbi:MAG: glycosyltransferase family 39 protein [candidate division WOR-3 bacterium]
MRNALFLLSFFLLRLIFALPALKELDLAIRINPDASLYQELGINMSRHDVFSGVSSPPYRPEGLRTPLYPLMVAVSDRLIGDTVRPVIILQALLWALTAFILLLFAEKRYGFAAGLITALLVLISPVSLKYGPALMSENLFVPVLVVAGLVFLRASESGSTRLFALSGLLFGLSALVRPSSLPLGVMLVFLVGRPLLKRGLVFAGLWAAPVGFWVIRNWLSFGFPFFSTAFSLNIVAQNAPRVIAAADGISLEEAEGRVRQDIRERYGADESWFYDPHYLNVMLPYGLEIIKKHPKEYVVLHAKGVLMCFLPSDPGSLGVSLGLWRELSLDPFGLINQAMVKPSEAKRLLREAFGMMGLGEFILFAFISLYTLALYGLAVAGTMRLRREKALLSVCFITIGVLVFMAGLLGSPRFRLPAEPFLALLAGGALLSRRRDGR